MTDYALTTAQTLFRIVMNTIELTSPQLQSISCPHPHGEHRLAYWRWGDARAPHVVLAVHGLTRQGRDFDHLAAALLQAGQGNVQVICPDVAGRGKSEWLPDASLYQVPQYAADMLVLLQALHAANPMQTLDWVGTSMGGLMGMVITGQPQLPMPVPVRRFVINDVGPSITWSSLERMKQYVGRYGTYADLPQAAKELRQLFAGFGPVPDDIWLEMCAHMVRPTAAGGLTLHYDPAIGAPLQALTEEASRAAEPIMWALYEQIRAQVLLIRGQDSDLLTLDTAQAMTERGPKARLVQWPHVGHAPTLTEPEHIQVLIDFLLD
ncbi:MAG: putative aminoacrylate hydrolase RutD [Pseudomonadota bacterium]